MEKVRLQHTTPKQAVEKARKKVIQERAGEQLGLKTRFSELNIAMRKYFRFNNVNLIAGMSGSGKSYFWNLITEDFLDYGEGGINEGINFIPIVLHFCFEMSSEDEILRAVANDLGVSFNYLLSSEYNKDTKDYNRLSDEEIQKVNNALKQYENNTILYYETAGNMIHIYNTIEYVFNSYNKVHQEKLKNNSLAKPYKLVVNIDHTLLIETIGKQEALVLMADVGKYAVAIRKRFQAMVNLIGQLNNKIEETVRLMKAELHYPQKSDIYAQGQLFNACDTVFTWHQPTLLKLSTYGTKKRPAQGLLHLLVLKARHGNIGSIWFLNRLSKGQILEYPKSDNTVIEDENLEDL